VGQWDFAEICRNLPKFADFSDIFHVSRFVSIYFPIYFDQF